jgi:hypothetical protein
VVHGYNISQTVHVYFKYFLKSSVLTSRLDMCQLYMLKCNWLWKFNCRFRQCIVELGSLENDVDCGLTFHVSKVLHFKRNWSGRGALPTLCYNFKIYFNFLYLLNCSTKRITKKILIRYVQDILVLGAQLRGSRS